MAVLIDDVDGDAAAFQEPNPLSALRPGDVVQTIWLPGSAPAAASASAGAVSATTVPFPVILKAVMLGGSRDRPLVLTFAPPVKMPWDGVNLKPPAPPTFGGIARSGAAAVGAAGAAASAGMAAAANAAGNVAVSKVWKRSGNPGGKLDQIEYRHRATTEQVCCTLYA